MELQPLKPRRGEGTLRIDDSDDLVVIENVYPFPTNGLPESGVYIENHGVIIVCTEGMAQFEHGGQIFQLHKNDMFIYMMKRSVITNFMSSQNFNCRQIWFTASEAWNVDMHGLKNLSEHLMFLQQHPKVSLSDQDAAVFDSYFQLLCRRMRERTPMLYIDIVRSLFSTMLLEVLDMVRRDMMVDAERNKQSDSTPGVHRQKLADRFMQLVEQSGGRIRKVDEFASKLNVTPKYLSMLLKETMNRRPSDIIHLFTLKAIEHRLRFTDMSIQEIANGLKFPNASFFGTYFKEHTGMTPMEYRNKYHKK
ncbi:MAG: helix-turn-helix domain-containing protein [Lachnospiraceae bacterium]|nr:helix-turn-helix domain-containing protein [Lachnospiraceae bacterium]